MYYLYGGYIYNFLKFRNFLMFKELKNIYGIYEVMFFYWELLILIDFFYFYWIFVVEKVI